MILFIPYHAHQFHTSHMFLKRILISYHALRVSYWYVFSYPVDQLYDGHMFHTTIEYHTMVMCFIYYIFSYYLIWRGREDWGKFERDQGTIFASARAPLFSHGFPFPYWGGRELQRRREIFGMSWNSSHDKQVHWWVPWQDWYCGMLEGSVLHCPKQPLSGRRSGSTDSP